MTPPAPAQDRSALLAQALDTIERLEARARAAEARTTDTPIAVVGLGARLPGGVTGAESYWDLLTEGRDAVRPVPADRWDADAFAVEDRRHPGGGFLEGWNPAEFDAAFFGISPRDAAGMDPQHRLLLEVAWEALEHAGIPAQRLRGTRTGVFVGITSNDYVLRRFDENPVEDNDGYTFSGMAPNYAAGRIAYTFGLQGPAVALDTACSSSLVTVHLACQSLRTGDSDTALAAGVHLMLSPQPTVTMSRWGGLAPDGRCKTFDESADGLGRGEGCGVVVLKRLPDALRDGDRVLAVVRGTAVNQDGASSGITVPNGLAQEALIRSALERSGLTPDDVDYVEAHGTGTPLGDPIELEALGAVFGERAEPLLVGSVKTNLAHCEAAAGVASFAKAVLAVQRGHVPAHLHHTATTSRIGARAARLRIAAAGAPWPTTERPRRAGVSAFGVTGTNAHVIVEQPPAQAPAATTTGPTVVPLSAASADALRETAERLAAALDPAAPLGAVAGTLAHRREHLNHRLAVVAADTAGLADALRGYVADEPHPAVVAGSVPAGAGTDERPVFVFSGWGSQWPGMGRELYATEPAFTAAIDELEPVLAAAVGELEPVYAPGFSLRAAIDAGEWGRQWNLPLLFAIQIALAATWRSYGIEPAAVLGHSMGEVAASVVAGALTPAQGARVLMRRTEALARVVDAGTMAMVELPPDEVEKRLTHVPAVTVAVRSSSRSAVISGPVAAVEALVATWEGEGLLARLVPGTAAAGHSASVEPMLPDLRRSLADLVPAATTVPVYSTAAEHPRDVPAFDGDYWAANFRNPVRFADAVTAAAADGHRLFLEVSPHPLVTRAVESTLADAAGAGDAACPVHYTLRRGRPERLTLLGQLGALHCAGVTPDWTRLAVAAAPVDLPTTAWQHREFWFAGAGRTHVAEHPLLGVHVRLPGGQDVWQAEIGPDTLPWLADHRSGELVVLPGAAYAEMALSAAARAFDVGAERVAVDDLTFARALILDRPVSVTTSLTLHGTGSAATAGTVEIASGGEDGSPRVVHATARVALTDPVPTAVLEPAALDAAHPVEEPAEALYTRLRAAGQDHGPAFAGVTAVATTDDPAGRTAAGRVSLPAQSRPGMRQALVHPVLLDACLQVLGAVPAARAVLASAAGGVLVPVRIGRLRRYGDPARGTRVRASLGVPTGGATAGDDLPPGRVELVDDAGTVLLEADDVRMELFAADASAQVDRLLYELAWEPVPLPPTSAAEPAGLNGPWAVLGDLTDPLVGAVAAGLGATTAIPAGAAGVVVVTPSRVADDALRAADPEAALAAAEDRVLHLIRTVQDLAERGHEPPRLWVVTRGAQQVLTGEPVAPEQAALRGLVRTLGFEHPELRATLLDVGSSNGGDQVEPILAELRAGAPEDEVALRDGERLVARLTPAAEPVAPVAARTTAARWGRDAFRLVSRHRGMLDALELRRVEARPPGPGEVQVAVRAAGVNFSDVLKALDAYAVPEGDERAATLGGEFAGVVTAAGDGVDLVPGDRVAGMAAGCFGTFVTAPADLVVPIPAGMTFAQAATVPVAFGTAWYALHHLAHLEAGERLLVHAASGGVGLAAIAIARAIGAEVLGTAGRDSKRDYLRERGVTTVMDSRSLDFVAETLAATGDGVDVVLNSLSGEALRRGFEVLAPHGRFVEMGKRDIHEDMRLGLAPFGRGLQFSHVDLDLVVRTRPALARRMLLEVFAALADGRLAPLPLTERPLTDATDVLRTMAAADHIGKLVLTVPEDGEIQVAEPDVPFVRSDGGYLVSGGLTGLGLAAAARLAERGAAMIVLNARSEPSPEAAAAIGTMRAGGTRVEMVRGDIAAPGTADAMVAAVTAAGIPLRGVIHSAAWLDDGVVLRLDAERLHRAWWPKAVGAWRLHAAVATVDLDWWAAFSTTSSMFGAPGQGNYAAASAYVDGLAQWRSASGLPGLAPGWGPWAQIGQGQAFEDRGFAMVTPAAGFAALERLVTERRTRTAVVPFDPAHWFAGFPQVASSSLFTRVSGPARSTGAPSARAQQLRADLEAIPAGPRRRVHLESWVADRVRGVLRLGAVALDPQETLSGLGLDSLMVLELRNQLEAGTGLSLPATLAWSHPTLAALAATLAERMGLPLDAGTGAPEPGPAAPEPELAPDVELTDDDAALLAEIFAAAEADTPPTQEGTP